MRLFRHSFFFGIFTLLFSFDPLQATNAAPMYDEQGTKEFKQYLDAVVATFRHTSLRPTNAELSQEIKKFVELGADPNTSNNINGSRPIDFAAENGDTNLITFLFEHGADIEANTYNSASAVIWAAGKRHIEASDLLITLGAKTKTEVLKQNLARFTKLNWNSSVKVELPDIKALVTQGANPNVPNGIDSWRSIHFAAKRGDVDLIDFLFSKGAEINVSTNFNNETPLYLAAFYGHTEVVTRLLGLGADNDLLDWRFNEKTREILSRYSATDLALPGEPELHRAIRLKVDNKELERILADSPNSIHQLDIYGQTALSVALIKRDEQAILFLLSHGANPLRGIHNGVLLARQIKKWQEHVNGKPSVYDQTLRNPLNHCLAILLALHEELPREVLVIIVQLAL